MTSPGELAGSLASSIGERTEQPAALVGHVDSMLDELLPDADCRVGVQTGGGGTRVRGDPRRGLRHSGGATALGSTPTEQLGYESKPKPKRSRERSQRLRLPVRSSRSSDQRVAWIPAKRNGSGGNGNGLR